MMVPLARAARPPPDFEVCGVESGGARRHRTGQGALCAG